MVLNRNIRMSNLNITYQIERNPIINIEYNNKITNKILCIGDPHLGRVFRTGVPAHRVGEREEGQYAALRRLLNPTDPLITHIVIMGDLFDKFVVSPTVVLKAVELLQEASNTNSNIEYYVIPGNHDMTKDTSKKSSYELFYEVFNGEYSLIDCNRNVTFKSSMLAYIYPDFVKDPNTFVGLYFDAYNAFHVLDYNLEISDHFAKATKKIAFGHWDSLDILDSGYTPSKDLLDDVDLVISGHEHTYKETKYPNSDTPVLFTGSLQPYTHAEDPDKDIYITVNYDQLSKYNLTKDFMYKCLRITCKPSFVLSEPIECLSLSYKILEEEVKASVATTDPEEELSYSDQLITWLEEQKDMEANVKKELKTFITKKEYL